MTEPNPTNRLLELRLQDGISRPGLADLLGVGEHQVRRWESGESLIPTKHLEPLVSYFRCSSDHLLGLDREPVSGEAA